MPYFIFFAPLSLPMLIFLFDAPNFVFISLIPSVYYRILIIYSWIIFYSVVDGNSQIPLFRCHFLSVASLFEYVASHFTLPFPPPSPLPPLPEAPTPSHLQYPRPFLISLFLSRGFLPHHICVTSAMFAFFFHSNCLLRWSFPFRTIISLSNSFWGTFFFLLSLSLFFFFVSFHPDTKLFLIYSLIVLDIRSKIYDPVTADFHTVVHPLRHCIHVPR